ncbi:MAG: CHAT domain-containing protein [Leptospira sp.]|nr:CHAT domain-containing protein [Leptospira sp.]
MIIRVIQKSSEKQTGQVFWEKEKEKNSSEIVSPFSDKLMYDFWKDWNSLLFRVLNNTPNRNEFLEKIHTKSNTFEQLLFGENNSPLKDISHKEPVYIYTDSIYANLPFEILKADGKFLFERKNFIRGIRSETQLLHKPDNKLKKFLLVSNSFDPSIESSVKEEVQTVKQVLENKFEVKVLKDAMITELRFIEEVTRSAYIHYVGHSDSLGIPLVTNNKISSESLYKRNFSNLKIVFLNSCESASGNSFSVSLAESFFKAGCGDVIGFLNPVHSSVAKEVGVLFWNKYKKVSNPNKILYQIKKDFYQKDSLYILTAISLVHFQSRSKKESSIVPQGIVYLVVFLFGILLLLFEKNKPIDSKMGEEIDFESKNTKVQERTKSKEVYKQNDTIDPLRLRIRGIQSPNFQKSVLRFLEEEHPILDATQRRELLEEIFQSSENEDVLYLNFKNRVGR